MRLAPCWTCPKCGLLVPMHLDVNSGLEGGHIQVRIRLTDFALADIFAHAWTHETEED